MKQTIEIIRKHEVKNADVEYKFNTQAAEQALSGALPGSTPEKLLCFLN